MAIGETEKQETGSEGRKKKQKNTMQINNEENIEGCLSSSRSKDQLMIDSKRE